MEFIDLKAQYARIEPRLRERMDAVLAEGRYIMGPQVQELEARMAERVGVRHCVTCANGTDALVLALMALGVGPGDAVFCPAFTFHATAESVALVGATPVFVDVDRATYNLCPQSLESAISATREAGELKPRAVIPVDLFGLLANYPAIEAIAEANGLNLVADFAQGFGASGYGKQAGAFGDLAATSFFPAKPLGCYGDGGAVFTDNDELAALLRSLRIHGKGTDKYDNVRIGMNSRLDTLQAAILLEKLAIFDDELAQRQDIARRYTEALAGSVALQQVPDGLVSAWAQFSFTVDTDRDALIARLADKGVPAQVYYPKPLHKQTAYRGFCPADLTLPNSEALSASILSVPMSPYLSHADQNVVIDALVRALD